MRRPMLLLTLLLLTACAHRGAPGFPTPVRPPVFIQMDGDQAYASLLAILENRDLPLVVEDPQFGMLRTDWVTWEGGELDPAAMAECPVTPGTQPGRIRARFGFDIRRRTVQSTISILTQWQIEAHPGMEEGGDRGFVECRSTGEWERMMEGVLTQRGTIR